jgi:hypothetical protein
MEGNDNGHCMSDGKSVESPGRQPARPAVGPGSRLLTGQNAEVRGGNSRVQSYVDQSRGNNHIGEQHQAQVGEQEQAQVEVDPFAPTKEAHSDILYPDLTFTIDDGLTDELYENIYCLDPK